MQENNFDLNEFEIFSGTRNKFGLRVEEGWILVNNAYAVLLKSENHKLSYLDLNEKDNELSLLQPQIGTPFSHEFSEKEADKVEFYESEDDYCMRVIFEPKEYDGLHFISVIKLKKDGLVENYYEIYNLSDQVKKDLNLNHSIYHDSKNSQFSIDFQVEKLNKDECYKTEPLFLEFNKCE